MDGFVAAHFFIWGFRKIEFPMSRIIEFSMSRVIDVSISRVFDYPTCFAILQHLL